MNTLLEKYEMEVLQLPASERAALAQILLASLDEDDEIEQVWALEAERRDAEIESGAVRTLPLAQVLGQVRAKLA